jgi:hypothetical protein
MPGWPNPIPEANAQDLARYLGGEGVAPMDQVAHQQQLATALAGGGGRGASAPTPPPDPGILGTLGSTGLGGLASRGAQWIADKITPGSASAAPLPPPVPTAPPGTWAPPPKPSNEDQIKANAHLASLVEQYHRGDATREQIAAAIRQLDQSWMKAFGAPNPDATWVMEGINAQAAAPTAVSTPGPSMSARDVNNTALALRASREMRRRATRPGGSEMPAKRVMQPSGPEMPVWRRAPKE